MSLYTYGNNSTISEIAVRRSAGRGVRSFLYLKDNAPPGRAADIKEALDKEGWHTVPTEVNGRDCLEVRGARKIEALEETLHAGGFIPAEHKTVVKDDAKISFKDKLKNNMLLVYGALNVVSDIGMIGYGWLHDKKLKPDDKIWENTASGLAYSAGSVTFALFGRGDKTDHHMRDLSSQLRDELHNRGLSVTEGSAVDSFTSVDNLDNRTKFTRFMNKHSSAIGNQFTALAGGFIAKGALKSTKPSTRNVDMGLGLSTLTAGTTAAWVKEQAPDPNSPDPTGFFGRAHQWIQARPNRVAGIGYGLSSLAHAYEVVANINSRQKDYGSEVVEKGLFSGTKKSKVALWAFGMRGGFVVLNMVAEGVLAFASKGRGSGVKSDKSVDETAYAVVADTIIHQPAAIRERLFTELSRDFLAKPEVLGGDAKEIEATLRARVKKLESNPWTDKSVVFASPPASVSVPGEKENTHWRGKLAASTPSPALTPAI